ncbi:MAG: type II secretion system F family protein [Deltaproteobacteria bacterium]|nr:type II secretion system F family protein [Deltaproteobacteria bacterium]
MPVYVWEGKTKNGEIRKGEVEADSEAAVNDALKRQQITPVKVKKKGKEFKLFGEGGKKITGKDIVIFLRQFATMIDAGLPLVQCLEILGSQQPNQRFKKILIQVKDDVESGSTFADALKKHPKTFDTLFVSLIAAGEIGGILDTILNKLGEFLEKSEKLKSKVKSAMVYPVSIVIVAIVITSGLLLFVIPIFEAMFSDMGGTLPLPTQIVINLSQFLQSYWYFVFGGMWLALFLFKKYYATAKGRAVCDKLFLKAPVAGDLIRKVAVAKFCGTMGTMLSSGVPILDSLEIVSKTAGNVVIENALIEVKNAISEGKTIVEPLEKTQVFPSMVVQMIAVGEATGALDAMLGKIAEFYEDEVDTAVDGLTALMEPAIMVVLGGLVGGLIIAMYLPIFSMAANV